MGKVEFFDCAEVWDVQGLRTTTNNTMEKILTCE